MELCEKSPAKDEFPVRTNRRDAANQQTTGNARGISDQRSLLPPFSRVIEDNSRDARRRTGGEFAAGNIVARSRGRPLDWLRLLQIT